MFNKLSIDKTKGALLLAYKLLVDSLFILFVAFIFAMLAEGILPGIISGHIGLSKIAMLIMLDILTISFVMRIADISEKNIANKKIAWMLFVVMGLLIFNGLLKLNIFLNLFILIIIFASSYFTFKIFEEEQS